MPIPANDPSTGNLASDIILDAVKASPELAGLWRYTGTESMIDRLRCQKGCNPFDRNCEEDGKLTGLTSWKRQLVMALPIIWLLAALQGCSVSSEFISELAGASPTGTASHSTPAVSPTPALKLIPTFTPTAVAVPPPAVITNTNLRQGPGTHHPIMGWLHQGTRIQPIARTADGMWLLLASGHWIDALSVNHVPQDLPQVPVPTPTPPA